MSEVDLRTYDICRSLIRLYRWAERNGLKATPAMCAHFDFEVDERVCEFFTTEELYPVVLASTGQELKRTLRQSVRPHYRRGFETEKQCFVSFDDYAGSLTRITGDTTAHCDYLPTVREIKLMTKSLRQDQLDSGLIRGDGYTAEKKAPKRYKPDPVPLPLQVWNPVDEETKEKQKQKHRTILGYPAGNLEEATASKDTEQTEEPPDEQGPGESSDGGSGEAVWWERTN